MLAGLTGVMRDMVREAVSAHAELKVVAECGLDSTMVATLRDVRADVVIGPAENGELPWQMCRLLRSGPSALLVVSLAGREAHLVELRSRSLPLENLSWTELVAAIRNAAGGRDGPSNAGH